MRKGVNFEGISLLSHSHSSKKMKRERNNSGAFEASTSFWSAGGLVWIHFIINGFIHYGIITVV